MSLDSIKIEVVGDGTKVQPAIDKVVELGQVDAKNAEQFKKTNAEYELAAKKRAQLLEQEIADLKALQAQRAKAYNPETLKALDQSIKTAKANVAALSKETETSGKSMAGIVTQTNNFGESVKKSYGFLRLAANIIPGLGISGIILLGYEALANIIEKISGDYIELETAQTKFNTTSIVNTNENTSTLKKFNEEIALLILQQEVLNKNATEFDVKNLQLINAYGKDLVDIKNGILEQKKKLQESRSELDKERNKVLEENRQKGLTGLIFGNGEDFDKAKELYDKKTKEIGSAFIALANQQRELENAAFKKYLEARKLAEKEIKKQVVDISIQDLENQKKTLDAQLKIDSIAAQEELGQKKEDRLKLNQTILDLTERHNIEILYLNEQIAKKQRDQDRKIAFATIKTKDDLNTRLYNIELKYNDKISGLRNDYYENSRVQESEYMDRLLADMDKASVENAKEVQDELKKRLNEVKDNEQRLADILKLQNEKNFTEGKITQEQHDKQEIEDQLAVLELKKTNLEEYSNEYIEIEIKEQELLRQLREKEKKELKKNAKEAIDNLKQVFDYFIKFNEERIQANIDMIDHQEELQKDAIETQRRQAELGHDNTLAFEEKQQADLEKKRMEEQKKMVRLKELETFLNSVASYSKDDPKQAVAKALAQLAIVKGVEASFMEEGGILGDDNSKSILSLDGWSKRHKSGNDILVHAERGEGMFSTKEVANMGGEGAFMDFKRLLAHPLKFREIPAQMSGVMVSSMNTKRLEDKLDRLEKAIENKPEWIIDWISKDGMDYRRETKITKGVREEVWHQLKRPKI